MVFQGSFGYVARYGPESSYLMTMVSVKANSSPCRVLQARNQFYDNNFLFQLLRKK